MRFYIVSDKYLNYLSQFDHKVPGISGETYKVSKPYIGIVLEIGPHKFLAPLTSYKEKQDRIKASDPGSFKLHERLNPDNKLGLIALTYMIPVPDSELTLLDIEAQSQRYKAMLYKQYEFIKANRKEIMLRAAKLYNAVAVKRTPHYVHISCDFTRLIDACHKFSK